MNISNSNSLKEKGKTLLPSLAQTFSKSPSSFVEGVYPVYADHGEGCYIFDVDKNRYIDYLMALGPIVLGYNYESVNKAIIQQLQKGSLFSLPHKYEINAAEQLQKIIPCAEMTRFCKTGSDSVTAAVRASRAITKRDMILYCGSGGVWDDWFTIATTRNEGIPNFNKELLKIFQYNNISELEQIFDENNDNIAAVIIEPTVYEQPKNNFLEKVKKITHQNDSLLVFDEILTGFRISNGGGQEYFGVTPDMATYAKGIANGMPLAAVVGKSEYMQIFDKVFVSTTYGGETLSLAACVATIKEFQEKNVCRHMWQISEMFREGYNKIAKENELDSECIGYYPRLKIIIRDEKGDESILLKSFFLQELIEKGIFMHPNTVLFSFSHSKENIEYTLKCINDVLHNLKKEMNDGTIKDSIKGEIPKEVIRMLK